MTSSGPSWDLFQPCDAPPEGVHATSPEYSLYVGRYLSRYLIEGYFWEYVESLGTIVSWTADGVGSKGRTRRALGELNDDESTAMSL